MGTNIVRDGYEIFFTSIPFGFFYQALELVANFFNFMLGLLGIDANIVAF